MLCLIFSGLLLARADAWAQSVRALESVPAANARIDARTTAFSVRFDKPVDHAHSVFIIERDGKVVETLHPRLESAPEVLFARRRRCRRARIPCTGKCER